MKNIYFWAFLLICTSACTYQKKECVYTTDNPTLQAYNDIVIALAENRFNHLYLGKTGASITQSHKEPLDTADQNQELAKAQNKIFNDPGAWCTLQLDTVFGQEQKGLWVALGPPILSFLTDSLEMGNTAAYGSVLDSLQTPETTFKASDFKTCTFAMVPASVKTQDKDVCHIGSIRLSRLLLNQTKNKGWLYYEFTCGQNCGKGEILLIEKTPQKWVIKKEIQLWSL